MAEEVKTAGLNLSSRGLSNANLSELGSIGLRFSSGIVLEEEFHSALKWPQSKKTFKQMSYDPTIAAANISIKSFIRKAEYDVEVKAPQPSDEQKAQVEFIRQCMGDMATSFNDVIQEALSILTYGYSIHEKVFKYRDQTGKHKSLYNDGKIGWAKLPVRSQDSVKRFYFDNLGRELKFVEQDLSLVSNQYDPDWGKGFSNPLIKLPRKKLLHFRHNTERNNPEGNSPLRACYQSWTYKTTIERFQAVGVSRDLGGIPVISLPPEYMSADADDDKKAVYEHYKQIVRNLHANEQAGLVLPSFYDDRGNQLFKFELMSNDGTKQYDTVSILNSYENKILMTYLADVLKLGQDASGSFALSDSKSNLLAVGIEAIVDEILQEFNEDLIPQTLLMNGWSLSNDMPRITLRELDERDLEVLGQFIQRVAATGLFEADEGMSEWLREVAGAPAVDRSKPLKVDMIAGGDSESGKGMENGLPNTNGKAGKADASAANKA
jgi:hypothetical protein